jgi:hypothetical protein
MSTPGQTGGTEKRTMARNNNITKALKLIAEAESLIAVVYDDESKGKRRA